MELINVIKEEAKEETDDNTIGSSQTTTGETGQLRDESNEAYLRAQNGFPIENVTCREGDNVEVTELSNIF